MLDLPQVRAENWLGAEKSVQSFVQSVRRHDKYFSNVRDNRELALLAMSGFGSKAMAKRVWVDSPAFTKGRLPVLFHQVPTQENRTLLVYLPGMNMGLESDDYTQWIASLLEKSGNHVLVLPGVFSRDYRGAEPLDPAGSFSAEAQVASSIIQEVIAKHIGEQNLAGIRLVGLSYGASIAGIMHSQRPAAYKDLTAISPPVKIEYTRRMLDDGMRETLRPYPAGMTKYKALNFNMLLGNGSDAKQIMFWAFHRQLVELALYFQRQGRCNWPALTKIVSQDPAAYQRAFVSDADLDAMPWTDPQFLAWIEEVNFTNVIAFCTPQNEIQYSNGHDSFLHWLERSRAGSSVRVVVASDDPISVPHLYEKSPLLQSGLSLLTLPYGGHNGFISTKWFADLIQSHF